MTLVSSDTPADPSSTPVLQGSAAPTPTDTAPAAAEAAAPTEVSTVPSGENVSAVAPVAPADSTPVVVSDTPLVSAPVTDAPTAAPVVAAATPIVAESTAPTEAPPDSTESVVTPSNGGTTVDSKEAETSTPAPAPPSAPIEVQPIIPAGEAPDLGQPTGQLAPVALGIGEHVETVDEVKQAEQTAADQGRAVVPATALSGVAVAANQGAPILESSVVAANPGSVVSTKNKASDLIANGGLTDEQIGGMHSTNLRAIAESLGWTDVINAAGSAVRALFKKAHDKALQEFQEIESKFDKR